MIREEEESTEGWRKYRYDILASNFDEDGVYELQVSSRDAAGNEQNNQLKDMPITFAVDRTAPSVVVTGIEDGGSYSESSVPYAVSVTDNLATGPVTVYVDGDPVAEYTAEEVREAGGRLELALAASTDYQEVWAQAADAAGNTQISSHVSALVSTNRWTLFYRNRVLFGGTVAATAAAIGLIIFLLIRKNRKKEEKGEA